MAFVSASTLAFRVTPFWWRACLGLAVVLAAAGSGVVAEDTESGDETPKAAGKVGQSVTINGPQDIAAQFDPLKKEADPEKEEKESDEADGKKPALKKKGKPTKKTGKSSVAKKGIALPGKGASPTGGTGGIAGNVAGGGGGAIPAGLAGLATGNLAGNAGTNGTTPSGGGTTTQGGGSAPQAGGDAAPRGALASLIELTNVERSKEQLGELTVSPTLMKMAQEQSAAMAKAGVMSHDVAGAFLDRMKASGYPMARAGENIAFGQKTPAEVLKDWMNSPGHRANIMNADFTEIGVGVSRGSNGLLYWTQVFGRPQ